jgi:hypothetical protein
MASQGRLRANLAEAVETGRLRSTVAEVAFLSYILRAWKLA